MEPILDGLAEALAERIVARKIEGDNDTRLIEKVQGLGIDEATSAAVVLRVVSERLSSEARLRRRLRRIESLFDAHREMRQMHPKAGLIPRIHNPCPEDFLEKYYAKGEPVILTGIFDHWPALHKWSPDYLRDQYGDVMVEVMMGRDADTNYEINRDEHKRQILLKDFIDLFAAGPSNDAYMVAHNFALSGPLAALSRDIADVPGILREPDNLTELNFWFGPAGTVTPLHHDDSNVLLGQIYGEKQIIIYPWSEAYLLYNEVAAFSRFDPEKPDFSRCPLSAKATRMTGILRRGEGLFIPVGTWHHIRSTSPSISLSMSQFVHPNRFTIHNP